MKIFLPDFFKTRKNERESFSNDHRRIKRYDIMLKLNYYDPFTKYQGESVTSNISRTGLRFPINTKIPKGRMIELKIEDPNKDRLISSMAKVIWVEEFVSGDDADDVIYEVGVKLLKNRLY